MERSVCRKLCEIDEAGSSFALATIIASHGSTPRKAGSAMLLTPDGQSWGSIGGGKGEGEIMQAALAALRSGGTSFCRSVTMNNAVAGDEGMVCGGEMEVFVLIVRKEKDVAGLA